MMFTEWDRQPTQINNAMGHGYNRHEGINRYEMKINATLHIGKHKKPYRADGLDEDDFTFCDAPLRRPLSHKALFPVGSSSTSSLVLGGRRTWENNMKEEIKIRLAWCAPHFQFHKGVLTLPNLMHQILYISYRLPVSSTIRYKSNVYTHPILPSHHTYNADVPELVCRSHGVVVQQTGRGHPAGICVIGEDNELVLVASVTNPEQALLNVRHNHTLADGMDASHQVWNVLKGTAKNFECIWWRKMSWCHATLLLHMQQHCSLFLLVI